MLLLRALALMDKADAARPVGWNDLARDMVNDNPNLPAPIKGPAMELVRRSMGVTSQIVGNLELVFRRGQQAGYEDGYRDATDGKPSRFSPL